MRTSGVICECSPPHAGHRYLFDCAHAESDALVAGMSGCFTQRGEAAVLSPQVRARLLLRYGVDAVFDLPFPFSSAPGEQFGAAGVSLLSGLGVDELWFGSECGDLACLRAAAEVTDSPEFLSAYRTATRSGAGTAAAYAACLQDRMGRDAPLSPNDLLAVSYLRALKRSGSRMVPHTVRRRGTGYRAEAVSPGEYPSASALRALLASGGVAAWEPYFGAVELAWIRAEAEAGRAPADVRRLDAAFLAFLRTAPGAVLDGVPGFGGGIGARLSSLARTRPDLDSVFRDAAVNCPTSRLRRGLLFALAGVTDADLRAGVSYAVLLAAGRAGYRFLAARRRSGLLPVVTKRREVPGSSAALRQLTLTEAAFGLWSLCLPRPAAPSDFLGARVRGEAYAGLCPGPRLGNYLKEVP